MAPKKSRSARKHSSTSEASPSKSQRKRKLADLIGPQWSKEELERFYRAYRKHGKDWGKVAAAVHNRSVEMIEALYTMNRAYLSLPKGYASAAGLIAMMTDFYTNMVNSDTERDKDTKMFQKPQKRPRTKGVDETLALDNSKPHSVASNNCYLSLLKKRRTGSRPWSVGKRTPRVPISHSSDKDSPLRRGLKLKVDTVDDDVAHEIAKALAEASKRVGSPQVSKTPNRKIDTLSPEQNGDQQHAESKIISTKVHGSEMDKGRCELSLGSTEADIGGYTRSKSGLKGKKSNRKKPKADENVDNLVDDIKEACSGTEEGQRSDVLKGKTKLGNREIKVAKSSSNNGLRKKSKKVLFEEDEDAALDALQTLADLSLRLPETTVDTESSLHVEKEKKIVLKSKLKGNSSTPGAKVTSFRAATHERADPHDVNVLETEDRPNQTKAALRERQKPALKSQFKILKHEEPADPHIGESDKSKDTEGKTNNCLSKGKCNDTVLPTQGKLKKSPEHASSSTSHGKESNDFAPSSAQILSTDQFELPTKVRSRRKIKMPTLLVEPDMKLPEKLANSQSNCSAASLHDRAPNLKEKIFYCLNRRLVRRWCVFEWFYNAIDYPWFAKREFLEYLDHVGLSHISRLTRVEWDVIRSSLGKPRRFSELFLKEEKEKLNEYRESVRQHYAELRAGARDGLPNDLAQPLSVGQRILALHPRTREICDGSVLTVDHNRYRVQFDQTERGVEFVMDIDCMPLNPLENLPESFTKHSLAGSTFIETVNGLELIGQPIEKIEGCIKCAPSVNIENRSGLARFCPSTYCMKNLQQTMGGWASYSTKSNVGCCEIDHTQDAAYTSQTSVQALTKTKEADIQALFDLTCALDKKEAVFLELKHMNDEILENQKDGENPLKQSDMFKKHYAALLLKLNEVNEQVSSALSLLRKRNTYQGSLTLFPLKSVAAMAEPVEQHSSCDYSTEDTHEFGSQVAEIVESSKSKAQIMVNAAMEAISSFEKEGTKLQSVAEVIDFVNDQLYIDDPPPPAHTSTPTNSFHATQASWYHLKSSTTNVSSVNHTSNHNQSHQNKSEILSELIAKCVATLLMIQKCTERQFPPSDVAQVLDSAVTSLKPYCLQNLPLYAEIQKCMGIIRNQILALVPT